MTNVFTNSSSQSEKIENTKEDETFQSFIREIWILKNTLCINHTSCTSEPLEIDESIFSGFFSALLIFSKSALTKEYLRNIDFMNNRFSVINQNNYSIIIRSSTDIPLKRIVQQTQIFALEIDNLIDLYDDLSEIKVKTKSFFASSKIKKSLSVVITEAIDQSNQAASKLRKVDIITLIQIAKYFINILEKYKLGHNNLTNKKTNSLIYNLIFNENNFTNDQLPNISYGIVYKEINYILNKNIEIFQDKITTLDNTLFKNLCKDIADYIEKNWTIITYFNLQNLFVSTFTSIMKYWEKK
ncbi:MAG: hypothetical protein ACXAC7_17765 [Candidatus Hodarchaeales archaeon]